MSIEKQITEILTESLCPEHLEVINESHMHNVPPGSESHFKVVAASEKFESLGRVKRHQFIYKLLSEQMQGQVHALAIHAYSPQEWRERGASPDSPQCMGGSKKS